MCAVRSPGRYRSSGARLPAARRAVTLPSAQDGRCAGPLRAVETVLNSPKQDEIGALDPSGVAVLMVAPGVDPGEQWLIRAIADLARRQDLVIVYGIGEPDSGYLASFTLTKQLRDKLPRRPVVAVLVSDHPDAARQEFDTIANLLDNSAIAIAITRAADQNPVAVQLAGHLQTRAVLQLDMTGYQPAPTDPPPARPAGQR